MFWDVLGLYLDPHEKFIGLCCDEKTQFQGMECLQPNLPLDTSRIRTEPHHYLRYGMITLFTAMNYLDGRLIQRLEAKNTQGEWLRILKQFDREMPEGVTIHVIADNYATHKHDKVMAWLARHPRFSMQITPMSASCINLVERFFADLTAVIRDGGFDCVPDLYPGIVRHLAAYNENPRPYKWTATSEDIIATIESARERFGAAQESEGQFNVRQLTTETIPSRVAVDSVFRNARWNTDEQDARIERDRALPRVMTSVMKDDAELF